VGYLSLIPQADTEPFTKYLSLLLMQCIECSGLRAPLLGQDRKGLWRGAWAGTEILGSWSVKPYLIECLMGARSGGTQKGAHQDSGFQGTWRLGV
jgi:hypothetical protein